MTNLALKYSISQIDPICKFCLFFEVVLVKPGAKSLKTPLVP
nr:hypothetical protein [Mycoplasmopsis bovis]